MSGSDRGRPSLLRSSAVVAIGTGLSRVTGLLRTIVLAWALGTSVLADSYNLANTTPNILYDLLLGGILSATLVPVFVANLRQGDDEGPAAIVTVTTVLLIAATAATMLCAPWIVALYTARGGTADAARLDEITDAAVPLLRLFLPQVLFYGLTTLATALLNSRDRFAAAAFAPVLNNIVVIAVLIAFRRAAGTADPSVEQVLADPVLLWLLGAGTTAGIVAMALVLWPALRGAGVRLRWRFDPRHPAVTKVVRLSGWTLGYVLANQVTLFVVLRLAAQGERGDVTAYSYAYLFFQLPFGLFAASVMTAAMPALARHADAGDDAAFRNHFGAALRLMVTVLLPFSVLLIVLARPAVAVLLQRGAFTAASTEQTATALAAFSIGLVGFSLYLLAMRGFYARKDTRTPFLVNLGQNALNVVLAVMFASRAGLRGLALAFSMAYLVFCVVALVVLGRRLGGLVGRDEARRLGPILVAATGLTITAVAVARSVGTDDGVGALVRLGTAGGVGLGVYVALLALLGALPNRDALRS